MAPVTMPEITRFRNFCTMRPRERRSAQHRVRRPGPARTRPSIAVLLLWLPNRARELGVGNGLPLAALLREQVVATEGSGDRPLRAVARGELTARRAFGVPGRVVRRPDHAVDPVGGPRRDLLERLGRQVLAHLLQDLDEHV